MRGCPSARHKIPNDDCFNCAFSLTPLYLGQFRQQPGDGTTLTFGERMTPLAGDGGGGGKIYSSSSKRLPHVLRNYNTLRVCSSELSHRLLGEYEAGRNGSPATAGLTTTNLDLLNPGYLPPPPNRFVNFDFAFCGFNWLNEIGLGNPMRSTTALCCRRLCDEREK